MKILDPACGSGSFLLGAYQYLLDWHLKWYSEHHPEKLARSKAPVIYQVGSAEWRLTTAEKKRILQNNIHGVDIDAQAVEVTKLSLLLKVLEGESQESIGSQLELFKERALPNLGKNIQCGNSLIGLDYYKDRQLTMGFAGEEERQRVNAFDWKAAFPRVFDQGGFDAVIGNPPYVRQEMLGISKKYFQKHYKVYHSTADLYTFFIEQGVNLIRNNGLFSYIVANKWMRANYGKPIRKWLKGQNIEEIIDFGDLPVFGQSTTYPCIIRICKNTPSKQFKVVQVKTLTFTDLSDYVKYNQYEVSNYDLEDEGWPLLNKKMLSLFNKIKSEGVELKKYVEEKIYYGIKTGLNKAFVIDGETRKQLIGEDKSSTELIVPFLAGRDIKRYEEPSSDRFLILIPRGWTCEKSGNNKDAWRWFKQHYPAIANHLLPYSEAAQKRFDKGEFWWELRACKYYSEFKKMKFILPDISLRGNFMLDEKGIFFCLNTAYIITTEDKYLLGILNSNLTTFIYKQISSSYKGGYLRFIYQYLARLPIHKINFNSLTENNQYKKVISLVDQMLAFHKQNPRTPQAKESLHREIEETDKQIDQLVYELYGLTEEEIKIVEGGS